MNIPKTYKKFKNYIQVAVDANRQNGIDKLMQQELCPEVILLDDAFQHRKVKPGYSILLTAFNNIYVNDWYLPTGDLRDSKREALRANTIVVTKCPKNLSISERNKIVDRINLKEHQKILFSYLSYNKDLKGVSVNLTVLKDKKVTLVTGIANPVPLVDFLLEEGLIFDHMKFNDHHFFTEQEIKVLKGKECILTTEKDYVRLKSRLRNLHYIEVSHQFIGNDKEVLEEALKQNQVDLEEIGKGEVSELQVTNKSDSDVLIVSGWFYRTAFVIPTSEL